MLDNTSDNEKRKKLIKVISHDVERIERLITDYSQMLKDEASLSRAKMTKINLSNVVNSVVEDFNSNLLNSNKNINDKLVIGETINNNFYVMTINSVKLDGENKGFIIVSEIANDILVAVDERKNFILRTVFSVALVILIFSVFLNKYILKPIRVLVL